MGLNKCQFEPWVGNNYWKGFEGGLRLLILGESHYGDGPPDRSLTQRLTCEYAEGRWNHRFWTGIMQVVAGRNKTAIDRMPFWQSVAFYNFIQEFVAGPRMRPASEAWRSARPAFDAVLEALRPQALLILGVRLWNTLPQAAPESPHSEREGPPLGAGEVGGTSWVYRLPNGHEVLAAGIHHPSSIGFSWERWHPVVSALLQH